MDIQAVVRSFDQALETEKNQPSLTEGANEPFAFQLEQYLSSSKEGKGESRTESSDEGNEELEAKDTFILPYLLSRQGLMALKENQNEIGKMARFEASGNTAEEQLLPDQAEHVSPSLRKALIAGEELAGVLEKSAVYSDSALNAADYERASVSFAQSADTVSNPLSELLIAAEQEQRLEQTTELKDKPHSLNETSLRGLDRAQAAKEESKTASGLSYKASADYSVEEMMYSTQQTTTKQTAEKARAGEKEAQKTKGVAVNSDGAVSSESERNTADLFLSRQTQATELEIQKQSKFAARESVQLEQNEKAADLKEQRDSFARSAQKGGNTSANSAHSGKTVLPKQGTDSSEAPVPVLTKEAALALIDKMGTEAVQEKNGQQVVRTTIQLTPERLGKIEVQLDIADERIFGRLIVASEETKHWVEQQLKEGTFLKNTSLVNAKEIQVEVARPTERTQGTFSSFLASSNGQDGSHQGGKERKQLQFASYNAEEGTYEIPENIQRGLELPSLYRNRLSLLV